MYAHMINLCQKCIHESRLFQHKYKLKHMPIAEVTSLTYFLECKTTPHMALSVACASHAACPMNKNVKKNFH